MKYETTPPELKSIWGPIKYTFWRRLTIGRFQVKAEIRSRKNAMGRFGGGWKFNLGIQAGGTILIINLLIGSILFSYEKPLAVNEIQWGPSTQPCEN